MNDDDIEVLAKMVGLAIDPAYLPGVARNLEILLAQTELLMTPPMPSEIEPAAIFRP